MQNRGFTIKGIKRNKILPGGFETHFPLGIVIFLFVTEALGIYKMFYNLLGLL